MRISPSYRETRTLPINLLLLINPSSGTPAYTLFATSPPDAKQKGRPNEPKFTGITLALIRLEQQKTDILIAVNVPHVPGQYDPAEVDPEKGKHGALLQKAIDYRSEIMSTFEIKDWNLFVQE